ncbi:hypothetical protein [Methylomonas koyamae]|uniref:Uncharacterized protein n=1 Tax=Methylomonas koyamae TaxID=702114 RepID=A0AA91I4P1_9GAMM|nr:hypothetical protein [Methylomonas koyamae]OAI24955.1 hypothetical protein A1356_14335 [Methylomonas koyamae]
MAYNQAISAPQADCTAGNAGAADREGAYLLGFTGKCLGKNRHALGRAIRRPNGKVRDFTHLADIGIFPNRAAFVADESRRSGIT